MPKQPDHNTKSRGIQLPCPCCGEAQANLTLSLADVEDGEAVTCLECEATFDLDRIRNIMAAWGPFLKWIDAAPFNTTEE